MTPEVRAKAEEAWRCVWDHEMPAEVALDMVQDVTGDVREAALAIIDAEKQTIDLVAPSWRRIDCIREVINAAIRLQDVSPVSPE